MTIQDLLESAQLDALGLLDEQDREAFERAFQAAPEALQKQIRREQERLCRMDALLPQIDLPDTLWPKVKAAVLQAQAAALAEVDGTVLPAAHAASHPAADGNVRPLPMARSASVHRLWRAGAIAFATAAVVLGAVTIHLRTTMESQARDRITGSTVDNTIAALGPEFHNEILFDRNTRRYTMESTTGASRADAAIFTNPKLGGSILLYTAVATTPGDVLWLVELGNDGSILNQLASFPSNGTLLQRKVNIGGAEPTQLALVSAPVGKPASAGKIVLRVAMA